MKILEFDESFDYDRRFDERVKHYMAKHRETVKKPAEEHEGLYADQDTLAGKRLSTLLTLTFDGEPFEGINRNDVLLSMHGDFRNTIPTYKERPVRNYIKTHLPELLKRYDPTVKHIVKEKTCVKHDFVDWKKEDTVEFLAEGAAIYNLRDEFTRSSVEASSVVPYSISQAIAVVITLLESKYDPRMDSQGLNRSGLATLISKLTRYDENSIRPAVSKALGGKKEVTGDSLDGVRKDLTRLRLREPNLRFIDECTDPERSKE
ncbi:MAG: hypothetical protein IPF59_09015 [Ignavibacteria bacterium]|nr:hypothetical protein [Ignavibacteria bacterium]MBK6420464.1 hypothetical protein [Ignavibacteria bacterium]